MLNIFKRGVEALRQPDRNPRCYELTEAEKLEKLKQWSARNVWNTYQLTKQDKLKDISAGA